MRNRQWTTEELEYLEKHYGIDMSPKDIAAALKRTPGSIFNKGAAIIRKPEASFLPGTPEPTIAPRLWKILTTTPIAVADLADKLDVSPRAIREAIEQLRHDQYLVDYDGSVASRGAPQGGSTSYFPPSKIDLDEYEGRIIRFGVISDNHMCSRYARPDVDEALYDIFAKEGITTVYNTGNWIDGEARFNKSDLNQHGAGNQCRYFAKNYPKRDGITTHFIAGDDHEGWYTQREGLDIGKLAESYAREEGRDDLVYLGYMEHDVVIPAENGNTVIRLMHPGGGSAYAVSYTAQQIANSLTGGTKPQILILGHYHKAEYLYYRGIHMIQAGCTMDQSPFMRKKRLSAHIGGWIVEFRQSSDGSVRRIKTEWISFFDGAFHENEWSYKMENNLS